MEDKFRKLVYYCMENNRWDEFEEWMTENSSFTFNFEDDHHYNNLFNELYNVIEDIIKLPKFLSLDESSPLFRYIEYEWTNVREEEKERIAKLFEEVFCKLKDSVSRFLICEILGGYFCDRRAFSVLGKIMKEGSEYCPDATELSVMGLRAIERKSDDPGLVAECRAALNNTG